MFRPRPTSRPRGFSLVEAMLAIVIVGVAVTASAHLLAVGTKTNADAHRLTTGLHLAVSVREMAYGKSADEMLTFNGRTLSPPVDARGQGIAGLDAWEQVITVQRMDEGNVTFPAGSGSNSRVLRLAVEVRFDGRTVTNEEWLIADTL